MKKWLTTLFLILAIAGSALAGMPLHSENTNSRMMKCCQKARSKEQSKEASLARLCCAVNCGDSAPTPSGTSFNFSPSFLIISDSLIKRIALHLFIEEKQKLIIAILFQRIPLAQRLQPKYLKHHSLLI